MASRPGIRTLRVHFIDVHVPVAPGAYSIMVGVFDNLSAVWSNLNGPRPVTCPTHLFGPLILYLDTARSFCRRAHPARL